MEGLFFMNRLKEGGPPIYAVFALRSFSEGRPGTSFVSYMSVTPKALTDPDIAVSGERHGVQG